MRVESPYSPISEPSPWWLKGLAIFMGIISLFMVLGTFSAIVSPVLVDTLLPDDFEEIEPIQRMVLRRRKLNGRKMKYSGMSWSSITMR